MKLLRDAGSNPTALDLLHLVHASVGLSLGKARTLASTYTLPSFTVPGRELRFQETGVLTT